MSILRRGDTGFHRLDGIHVGPNPMNRQPLAAHIQAHIRAAFDANRKLDNRALRSHADNAALATNGSVYFTHSHKTSTRTFYGFRGTGEMMPVELAMAYLQRVIEKPLEMRW